MYLRGSFYKEVTTNKYDELKMSKNPINIYIFKHIFLLPLLHSVSVVFITSAKEVMFSVALVCLFV